MTAVAMLPNPALAGRRPVSVYLIAAAVLIPTFMEVLDTTIANVALRYIAGGLSAPATDSEWVITSYLAANAIILPISGWIGLASVGATIFCCLLRSSPSRPRSVEWRRVSTR